MEGDLVVLAGRGVERVLQRTVSFWHLVGLQDGQRLEPIDWPSFMSELSKKGPRSGHDIEDSELSGTVYTRNEIDHLVLTKDRDDLPREQHMVTGQVADMRTAGNEWAVIESAFIMFLEFGNVFGYLRSANTAPSPQAVAKWINKTKLLSVEVRAEPVVDPERWTRLKRAGGVTCLEVAASTNILGRDIIEGPLKELFSLGRMGNFKVQVKLIASRARKPGYRKERRRLYDMTEAVITDIGLDNVHTAKARIFDEDNAGIPAETINLIKQRFAIRRDVAMIGAGRARSVSELSALDAILSALDEFEGDLRKAVGVR
ncbi:MAG: hypothetical protein JO345_04810 [Streptosporangiaceae bacterium]|nr:hypothetical protein [Streptosporangiaceae bacterium]